MSSPAQVELPHLPNDPNGNVATVRTFFALVPDEPVRVALVDLARDVARRSRGRAVTGEHVHLTLAFLGDVPATDVPALRDVGASIPHLGAVLDFDTLGAWRASGVAWTAPSVTPPALVGAARGARHRFGGCGHRPRDTRLPAARDAGAPLRATAAAHAHAADPLARRPLVAGGFGAAAAGAGLSRSRVLAAHHRGLKAYGAAR